MHAYLFQPVHDPTRPSDNHDHQDNQVVTGHIEQHVLQAYRVHWDKEGTRSTRFQHE